MAPVDAEDDGEVDRRGPRQWGGGPWRGQGQAPTPTPSVAAPLGAPVGEEAGMLLDSVVA